jgi:hypothetical protein
LDWTSCLAALQIPPQPLRLLLFKSPLSAAASDPYSLPTNQPTPSMKSLKERAAHDISPFFISIPWIIDLYEEQGKKKAKK